MKQQTANKIGIFVLAITGVVLCTSAAAYAIKTKYIPPVVSGDTASGNEQSAPLEKDVVRVLVAGIDDTGMLTDVIMVGMFDVKSNTASVLQIPRDSFVGNIYPTGKINSVYGHPMIYEKGDGMQELKAVIMQQFKLPIDYYASISLASFREIINSMGG
ncbi:MAG: LCP family protein, partial [Oscillospiraceae bacterium]